MLSDIYQKLTDWHFIVMSLVLLVIGFVLFSYQKINVSNTDIYNLNTPELSAIAKDYDVAIVFGGGISDDGPLPLLKDRLDTAKKLLEMGIVKKVLLSGDNRFENYNEPDAMFTYLTDQGVSPSKLVKDYAGRSTYETCERANKIFGLEKAILISEETHLPRARYLCDHFKVETIGVVSEGIATAGKQIGQTWREILARPKAVLNVYVYGEQTVLGEPEPIN